MFPIFVHVECICNSIGSKDEDCNKITGECSCKVGFTGTNCNGCATGFTGSSCNECVPGYDDYGGYPNCAGKFIWNSHFKRHGNKKKYCLTLWCSGMIRRVWISVK